METQLIDWEPGASTDEEDNAGGAAGGSSSSPVPVAFLVVTNDGTGENTQKAHELLPGVPCTVGRAPDATICLEHVSVSSGHAVVERFGDALWTIKDGNGVKASSNGVFVNGVKLSSSALADGDTVTFGKVACIFQVGSSPRLPAGPKPAAPPAPTRAPTPTRRGAKSLLLASDSDDDSDTDCEEEIIVTAKSPAKLPAAAQGTSVPVQAPVHETPNVPTQDGESGSGTELEDEDEDPKHSNSKDDSPKTKRPDNEGPLAEGASTKSPGPNAPTVDCGKEDPPSSATVRFDATAKATSSTTKPPLDDDEATQVII